jgi:hypothetical protein
MATQTRSSQPNKLRLGAVVVDERDPNDTPLIVVNEPPVEAQNWTDIDDQTLAETRPEYPPNDDVFIAVERETLHDNFPAYGGIEPIKISRLTGTETDWRAFPRSQLQYQHREREHPVPISDLLPSPYHAQDFSLVDDGRLVAAMDRANTFFGSVDARITHDGRLRMVNGHKRVWAATVAGIETVPTIGHSCRPLEAAEMFARMHLKQPEDDPDSYVGEAREEAIRCLQTRFGTQCAEIPYVPVPNG